MELNNIDKAYSLMDDLYGLRSIVKSIKRYEKQSMAVPINVFFGLVCEREHSEPDITRLHSPLNRRILSLVEERIAEIEEELKNL